ncbi:14367_t:CDS:2 [Funneliformis geosporum]|uniref:14367_t:CDS:1 n=1 Tax=Funneliformis geosporum TaxID=1117311 RepID=A0A9W4T6K8_9GLOM|nr:14367_t:CDS:2 [Funneliformis geosporum]
MEDNREFDEAIDVSEVASFSCVVGFSIDTGIIVLSGIAETLPALFSLTEMTEYY